LLTFPEEATFGEEEKNYEKFSSSDYAMVFSCLFEVKLALDMLKDEKNTLLSYNHLF